MKLKSFRPGALIVILFFLSAMVFIYFLFDNKEDNSPQNNNGHSLEEQEISFSRISFFNNTGHRANLNIPEFWEGNYRLREKGDEAVFYYIEDPLRAKEIFSIKFAREENGILGAGWKEILRKDGFVYFYSLSTGNDNIQEENENYKKMTKEAEDILKSFSVE